MQMGLGEIKKPNDFGFTRSKVSATKVTFVKNNVFCSISWELFITQLSYFTFLARTWHVLILGSLGQISRSQGPRVLNVKTVFALYLRTICHRTSIFHMQISLSEDMTPSDFGCTRLKVKVTMVKHRMPIRQTTFRTQTYQL